MNPDNIRKIPLLKFTDGASKRLNAEQQNRKDCARLMEFDERDESRAAERPMVIAGLKGQVLTERFGKFEVMYQMDRLENDFHLSAQKNRRLERENETLLNIVVEQKAAMPETSGLSTGSEKTKDSAADRVTKKKKI